MKTKAPAVIMERHIHLIEPQHAEWLRRTAERTGAAYSVIIRRLIDAEMAREERHRHGQRKERRNGA